MGSVAAHSKGFLGSGRCSTKTDFPSGETNGGSDGEKPGGVIRCWVPEGSFLETK
jgi:hypothetical protein